MSSTGQIVGGVIGAAVGGMMGNPVMGAQVGIMLGGAIDPPAGPDLKKPKLSDLQQSTSTYGSPIPRSYSTVSQHCNFIWLKNNKIDVREVDSGGKGAPPASASGAVYEYKATFAILVKKGPCDAIGRIWCSGKLLYDPTATTLKKIRKSKKFAKKCTFYLGTETQEPDPTIQADRGVAYTPAYTGYVYIVIRNFDLTPYGNSLGGCDFNVETITNSTSAGLTLIQEVSAPYKLQDQGSYEHSGTGTVYEPHPYYMSGKKVLWYCPNWDQDVLSEPSSYFIYETTGSGMSLVGEVPLYFGDMLAFESLPTGAGDDKDLFWFFKRWLVGDDSGLLPHNGTFKHIGGYNVGVTTGDIVWCAKSELNIALQENIRPPTVYQLEVTDALCATLDSNTNYVYVLTDAEIIKYTTELEYVSTRAHSLVSLTNPRLCYDAGDDADYLWIFTNVSNNNCAVHKLNLTTDVLTSVGTMAGTSFGSTWGGEVWVEDGIIVFAHPRNTESPPELAVEWYHEGAISGTYQTLEEIVEAECLLSGLLESGDIDATDLTQEVRGYRVSEIAAIRGSLEHLQAAFQFDVYQSGYQLKFVNRGQSSVATFTADDLALDRQLTETREMDTQIPYKVIVKHIDADNREYEMNEQYSQRQGTDAINVHEKQLAIVLTPDEASQIAEKLLYSYWTERRTYEFYLPPTARDLEPSDVITVTIDYATFTLRLTSIAYEPDGRLKCFAVANNSAVYTSTAVGGDGQTTSGELAGNDSDTNYILLDIPTINESLLYTSGFYVSVYGDESDWSGGAVMRSTNDGASFSQLVSSPYETTTGICQTALGAIAQPFRIDASVSLNVQFVAGTPESITQSEMLNGSNHYAYGDDGRWEIIAIQNWELEADGSYTGTQMLRGLFGSDVNGDTHLLGDKLVHLNDTDLLFAETHSSRINDENLFRGISFGEDIDTDTNRAFTYCGVNLKPLKPINVIKYKNTSNNWIISWTRQDRFVDDLRDGVDAPMSEDTEEYRVRIYSDNTYTTVLREIIVYDETSTYTSAQQTEDGTSGDSVIYVAVYQISQTAGYGYPSVDVATSDPTLNTYVVNTEDETVIAGDGIVITGSTISTDGKVDVIDSGESNSMWVMLADTVTGRQKAMTDESITYDGTKNQLAVGKISLGAGGTVAGYAPMYLTGGNLLSTIEAGAVEFDGLQTYVTNATGMGREIFYTWVQNNTPTASNITSTLESVFDEDIHLYNTVGSGYYHEVEVDIGYTHTGTRGTVTFTFTASLAPTNSAWWIRCNHTDPLGAASSGSSALLETKEVSRDLRANGAGVTTMSFNIPLTAAGTSSTSFRAKFDMMFATQANATPTTIKTEMSATNGTISASGITSWKSRIRGASV